MVRRTPAGGRASVRTAEQPPNKPLTDSMTDGHRSSLLSSTRRWIKNVSFFTIATTTGRQANVHCVLYSVHADPLADRKNKQTKRNS